jgi:hypothetical protein
MSEDSAPAGFPLPPHPFGLALHPGVERFQREEIKGGDVGFRIFIAARVVAGIWHDAQEKAAKHETLRRLVEKTGTIDEAKLKELFDDTQSDSKPGYAYRGRRALAGNTG